VLILRGFVLSSSTQAITVFHGPGHRGSGIGSVYKRRQGLIEEAIAPAAGATTSQSPIVATSAVP